MIYEYPDMFDSLVLATSLSNEIMTINQFDPTEDLDYDPNMIQSYLPHLRETTPSEKNILKSIIFTTSENIIKNGRSPDFQAKCVIELATSIITDFIPDCDVNYSISGELSKLADNIQEYVAHSQFVAKQMKEFDEYWKEIVEGEISK